VAVLEVCHEALLFLLEWLRYNGLTNSKILVFVQIKVKCPTFQQRLSSHFMVLHEEELCDSYNPSIILTLAEQERMSYIETVIREKRNLYRSLGW
jgi:hypothetical protein